MGEQIITLGGGKLAAWFAVIGYGSGSIFAIFLGILLIGFSIARKTGVFRLLWILGIAVFLCPIVFVYEGYCQFATVGTIKIEPAGGWNLHAPAGNNVGYISADTQRSILLWAEITHRKRSGRTDDLHGIIRTDDGKEYSLNKSKTFDLLIQLGYGPYWINHKNRSLAEEKKAEDSGARMVFAGKNKEEWIVLPAHSYNAEGISSVQEFLSTRVLR